MLLSKGLFVALLVILLLKNPHVATAQCEIEFNNYVACFEAQPVDTRGACFECVQNTIDGTVGTVTSCADFSRIICPSIQTGCPGCDGCERATEVYLTCLFGAPSNGCPFFCGFDKDPWEPTDCTSENAIYAQCFDDLGTSRDECNACIQAGIDGIGAGQVRYCGQFSDILCPVIEPGCPACDGCEGQAELLLSCSFMAAENSCPFFCGFLQDSTPMPSASGTGSDVPVVTPAPVMPAPVTPAPVMPAPVTPAPTMMTSLPTTPEPTNPAPTAAPVSQATPEPTTGPPSGTVFPEPRNDTSSGHADKNLLAFTSTFVCVLLILLTAA